MEKVFRSVKRFRCVCLNRSQRGFITIPRGALLEIMDDCVDPSLLFFQWQAEGIECVVYTQDFERCTEPISSSRNSEVR